MTASVRSSVPSDSLLSDSVLSVVATAADVPLSVQAADYARAVADGAVPVDIRDPQRRAADGALLGALAIDAARVLDHLVPDGPQSLSRADVDARWILVGADGHDAEWLAWHLQARGVRGAVFVVGGYPALRRAKVNGSLRSADLDVFAAHGAPAGLSPTG